MNDLKSFEIRNGQTKNERYFKGYIEKQQLPSRMHYYGFQLHCHDAIKINLQTEKESSVYLCINLAEKSHLTMSCGIQEFSVPPYASVLVPFKRTETVAFHCDVNKRYDFLLLKMEKSELDTDQTVLLQKLQDHGLLLDAFINSKTLAPNLALCEIARTLKKLDKATCENKFIAKGYCNILFGLKLKELLQIKETSSKLPHLRNFEIQQLEALTNTIKTYPHRQYTIKSLCKQTGLSVSKLQLGFKEMHNCTVAIFIRNIRLEKALDMLRNTDLNVSEIVYSVGLTSRSYFCRIFKKRFKCSPKTYQQQLRLSAMAS